MALIKCPECGKEISDTVKRCPNCGYHKKIKFDKKKRIIGGGVVLFAIIACIAIFIFTNEKPLNELEQKAVKCVLDYKSMLKNPDSLQVHDIRWEENELVDGMIFIYLDTSGQNGFGGNTRDVARYGIKGEEITYQGSSDDDDSSWEELIAENIEEGWQELQENDNSVISVERVMKEADNKK